MRISMKQVFISILVTVFAGQAIAADLTCTLPAAYVSRGVELCEELRLRLNVRTADWSNDACASEFLRIGFLAGDKKSVQRASSSTVSDAVNDAVASFTTAWPRIVAATCGDGTPDTEFGETCDDGNASSNDDCTNSCESPICGDGIIHNEGSGIETCDDGNLVDLDGCDRSCQTE
jgi:cysteine-rich repeat protein